METGFMWNYMNRVIDLELGHKSLFPLLSNVKLFLSFWSPIHTILFLKVALYCYFEDSAVSDSTTVI